MSSRRVRAVRTRARIAATPMITRIIVSMMRLTSAGVADSPYPVRSRSVATKVTRGTLAAVWQMAKSPRARTYGPQRRSRRTATSIAGEVVRACQRACRIAAQPPTTMRIHPIAAAEPSSLSSANPPTMPSTIRPSVKVPRNWPERGRRAPGALDG